MKFLLIFVFVFTLTAANQIVANDFNVDYVRIDSLIVHAQEVDFETQVDINHIGNVVIKQKNPFVAWLLTYTIVGFHRLYLGTELTTFAAYFFTLGGFLILDIITITRIIDFPFALLKTVFLALVILFFVL